MAQPTSSPDAGKVLPMYRGPHDPDFPVPPDIPCPACETRRAGLTPYIVGYGYDCECGAQIPILIIPPEER